MTNQERQKSLDLKKYFSSQRHKEDLSGKMCYCHSCSQMTCTHTCRATQKEREAQSLCAKAYNRMKRAQYGTK